MDLRKLIAVVTLREGNQLSVRVGGFLCLKLFTMCMYIYIYFFLQYAYINYKKL